MNSWRFLLITSVAQLVFMGQSNAEEYFLNSWIYVNGPNSGQAVEGAHNVRQPHGCIHNGNTNQPYSDGDLIEYNDGQRLRCQSIPENENEETAENSHENNEEEVMRYNSWFKIDEDGTGTVIQGAHNVHQSHGCIHQGQAQPYEHGATTEHAGGTIMCVSLPYPVSEDFLKDGQRNLASQQQPQQQ